MAVISRPQVTIDCILSRGSESLVGDGCVYEISISRQQITSPRKLQSCDYVKLRLWLPGEDSCILIQLGEIQWVKDYWIKAEFIKVGPNDQARKEQFLLALET